MTTRTAHVSAPGQQRRGLRRGVDIAYGYLAAFFVLGVLFQVYLAGVGVFGINARKVANASSLNAHRAWGSVLMILSIILLILALVAWQSVRTVISTFVLALLTCRGPGGTGRGGRQRQVDRRAARVRRDAHPAAVAVAGRGGLAAPDRWPDRRESRIKKFPHPA